MVASFLLSLREGLEAALIIGIVLGVLTKFHRPGLKKKVWYGVAAAILMSLLSGGLLNLLGVQFEGRGEAIFEGVVLLLAAALLTWMVFWMQRSAETLKSDLEQKTRKVADQQDNRALFSLAFLAVFREGIELALFLMAVQQTANPFSVLTGALIGLMAAVLLGWGLFSSTRRLNLQTFFRVTNLILILFAAGMVAYGVHELNEAGIIPAVIENVWNINGLLDEKSTIGLLLKAMFGYNGNPSLSEVLTYLLYLGGISTYVFKHQSHQVQTTVNVK